MMRSLYSGVSGLRNHQTRMDVVGNNIANVNTVGYKAARTIFQDLYSQNLRTASAPGSTTGGTNPTQVGLGVTLQTIDNLFTTSAAQVTGNTYDLMIQNDGFFVVRNGTQEFYTRAGNFYFDKANYLVTANGHYLMGFQALISEGTEAVAAEPSQIEYIVSDMVERVNDRKILANRDSIDVSDVSGAFSNATITLNYSAGTLTGLDQNGNEKYTVTLSSNGKTMTIKDKNNSNNVVTVKFDYNMNNVKSELDGRTIEFDAYGMVDGGTFTTNSYPRVNADVPAPIGPLAGYTLTITDDAGTGAITALAEHATEPDINFTGTIDGNNVLTLSDGTNTIEFELSAYIDEILEGETIVFDNLGVVNDTASSIYGLIVPATAMNARLTSSNNVLDLADYEITITDVGGSISAVAIYTGATVPPLDDIDFVGDINGIELTLTPDASSGLAPITIEMDFYTTGSFDNATLVFDAIGDCTLNAQPNTLPASVDPDLTKAPMAAYSLGDYTVTITDDNGTITAVATHPSGAPGYPPIDLIGSPVGANRVLTLTNLSNTFPPIIVNLDEYSAGCLEGTTLSFTTGGAVDTNITNSSIFAPTTTATIPNPPTYKSSLLDPIPYPVVADAGSVSYGTSQSSTIISLANQTLTITDDGNGNITATAGTGAAATNWTGTIVGNKLTLSDNANTLEDINIVMTAYTPGCLDTETLVFGAGGVLDASASTLIGDTAAINAVSGADQINANSTIKTIKFSDKGGLISTDEWDCTLDTNTNELTMRHKTNPANVIVITLDFYESGCLNNTTLALDSNYRVDRANSSILSANVGVPSNYYIFGDADRTTAPTTEELMEYVTIGLPGAKREATYDIIDDANSDIIIIVETDRNGTQQRYEFARPRESNNFVLSAAAFGLEIQVNSNYQAGDLNGFSIEMDGTGIEAIAQGSPLSIFSDVAENMNRIYVDPLLYNVTIDDKGIVSGLAKRDGIITCPTTGQQIYVLADQRVEIGQVVVSTFENQQALEKVGDNLYRVTNNTGDPVYNKSGVNGAGTIKPGTLEMSNVDLSQEFTDMIVTQRGFQANSRVITVSDTLLEELINLKR